MGNTIVNIKNVSLTYRTKYQVVNLYEDLNLQIKENEYLVVKGKSGSGKSTLLNLIAGYLKPTSGQIWINDKDISRYNQAEINAYRNKKVGYIFQSFHLIYQFTVLENVMTPLLIAGVDKKVAMQRAKDLLIEMRLENRGVHFPNELSGGEQQRVAIARALANDPDLILADEPTGNLDFETSKKILECIDEVHKKGKTIVLVTHDDDVVKRATRVIDMKELL